MWKRRENLPLLGNYINHKIYSIPANALRLAGGNRQKWNILDRNVSRSHVEYRVPQLDGMDMVIKADVKQIYDVEKSNNNIRQIDDSKLLVPLHVDRTKYETHEELFKEIRDWWVNVEEHAENTILERIRYARAMANHPIYPVDWFKFEPEQIICQLQYKRMHEYPQKAEELGKDKDTYGICQLHNDWKTVNTFAEAFGIIDVPYWGYHPPEVPEPQRKIVPRPYIVHKLMNYKYTPDRYTNVLIKTIQTVGFQVGWRPEEAPIQKISDIYFDDGYIVITEPKKKKRQRQVWLDDRVLNSPRQNSLRNLVYIWRPRYATKESKDFLFIKKDGRPFSTVHDYRMFLNRHVKPVWKPFSPKIMRDWCAIAKLIRTKTETKKWDIRTVKNALGHRKEDTTEDYVKFAEEYYRNDKFDWLSAVLKFHHDSKKYGGTVKQVESIRSDPKIEKRLKSAVCGQIIRRKINAPVGD